MKFLTQFFNYKRMHDVVYDKLLGPSICIYKVLLTVPYINFCCLLTTVKFFHALCKSLNLSGGRTDSYWNQQPYNLNTSQIKRTQNK